MIYLIGSLRDKNIPIIANRLRAVGHEVFDEWYAAGPEADDYWRDYEKGKGNNLAQAIKGYAAQHIVDFDRLHLIRADVVVLVMPCGKSGHMELGYKLGHLHDSGANVQHDRKAFVLLAGDPDRFDVMYGLGANIVYSVDELITKL